MADPRRKIATPNTWHKLSGSTATPAQALSVTYTVHCASYSAALAIQCLMQPIVHADTLRSVILQRRRLYTAHTMHCASYSAALAIQCLKQPIVHANTPRSVILQCCRLYTAHTTLHHHQQEADCAGRQTCCKLLSIYSVTLLTVLVVTCCDGHHPVHNLLYAPAN